MRMRIVALLACLVAAPLAASANQVNVNDIVKKMKSALEPASGVRQIQIKVRSEGETVQWTAAQAAKVTPAGRRMTLVVLDPPDLRGIGVIIGESQNQSAPVWVYMPVIRRVRKLVGPDAYEHFLGTDFSFADLGFVHLDSKYKLLGEDQKDGHNTYRIEETRPKDRFFYSKIIIWVARDTFVPVAREYYDITGQLWKTESVDSTIVDGIPTALQVTMKDVQANESTELDISAVRYDEKIADSLFDPDQLRDAINSPVWKSVAIPGSGGK